MAPSPDETEKGEFSCGELLSKIRVSLGGRAAELLCFGEEAGLTTGASGDLEHASNIARRMAVLFGMSKEYGLLTTPELMKYESALSSPIYLKLNRIARRMLEEQMEKTTFLLQENRTYLDAVALALVERERLTTEDLKKILPKR